MSNLSSCFCMLNPYARKDPNSSNSPAIKEKMIPSQSSFLESVFLNLIKPFVWIFSEETYNSINNRIISIEKSVSDYKKWQIEEANKKIPKTQLGKAIDWVRNNKFKLIASAFALFLGYNIISNIQKLPESDKGNSLQIKPAEDCISAKSINGKELTCDSSREIIKCALPVLSSHRYDLGITIQKIKESLFLFNDKSKVILNSAIRRSTNCLANPLKNKIDSKIYNNLRLL